MMRSVLSCMMSLSLVGLATGQLPPTRAMIGKSEANHGAITIRTAEGRFQPQKAKAMLPADELMILLPGSVVTNPQNSVAVTAVGEYDGLSPLPVLETAIKLHETNRYDMALTLERGRLDLENRKKSGASLVEVRFANQKWLITLEKPASRVTLELASRWAPGSRMQPKAVAGHAPTVQAVLVVGKGTAEVDTAQTTFAMTAPPGPARLNWNSLAGLADPQRLEKLPPWVDPNRPLTPLTVQTRVAVEQFRELWMVRPELAFETLIKSNRPADRRVGLVAAGAFDELLLLAEVVTSTSELDLWDFGVTVFRHWLGREAAQEQRLYKFLVEQRQFPPAHADILIGLLNGFAQAELSRPETYEVLIEYLQHDRATIRNLAAWHLVRLVPAGKSIPFKPNASKEQFRQTYNRWKQLIPPGTLPATAK